jgi:hypothetical protein
LRVAALAFGVLAGLVASLILALGGLDVSADLASLGERQVQAIRFGLIVIGNLGVFGAALVLAFPMIGAIFLILGALAWVGAALLTHHTTDFVLITPPALLLIGAIFAGIAHFRRPRDVEVDEPEIEIIAPERARPSDMMGPDEEMGVPGFASEPSDRVQASSDEWNPRRRQPPPPRTKPAFRPLEDEYDDEPSGFSRFALGLSGVLSFGLYAALAGAAILIFWNLRNDGGEPAAAVAEAPSVSAPAVSSSAPSSSSEPEPEPIRLATTEPSRAADRLPTALPSIEPPSSSAAATPPSSEPPASSEPIQSGLPIPTLPADFLSEDDASSPPAAPSSEPPPQATAPSAEPSSEPAPVPSPTATASVPAAGQPMPRLVPVAIAALRGTPSPGVTTVARPAPASANTTGL